MEYNLEKSLNNFKVNFDIKINNFFDKFILNEKDDWLRENFIHLKDYVANWWKRIRPFLAFEMNNEFLNINNIEDILIAFELLHASSLLDDDVLDEHKERRWKPTIPVIYENKKYNWDFVSFLSSNILRWIGVDLILNSKIDSNIKNQALIAYQDTWKTMDLWQIIDLEFRYKLDIPEDKYINRINLWTANFIAHMFQVFSPEKYKKDFFNIWKNLGLAFQLMDDLMDIDENKKKWRALGSDIKEGTATLLSIYTYEKLNNIDKLKFEELFWKKNLTQDELLWIIEQYGKSWSIDNLKELIKKYVNNAELILDDIWIKRDNWIYSFSNYSFKRIN